MIARCENACGKFPSCRFAFGSYSSASNPRSFRTASRRSNHSRALSFSRSSGDTTQTRTNRAEKRRLVPAIRRHFLPVGDIEERTHLRASRAPPPRWCFGCVRRPAAEIRQAVHQNAGIHRVRAVRLRERFFLRVVAALANFGVNLIARFFPAFEMSVRAKAKFLDHAHAAIEREPRHDFRMREMTSRAAHFPDSFVRLLPFRFEKFQERNLQCAILLR